MAYCDISEVRHYKDSSISFHVLINIHISSVFAYTDNVNICNVYSPPLASIKFVQMLPYRLIVATLWNCVTIGNSNICMAYLYLHIYIYIHIYKQRESKLWGEYFYKALLEYWFDKVKRLSYGVANARTSRWGNVISGTPSANYPADGAIRGNAYIRTK